MNLNDHKLLGELLVAGGKLDPDDLDAALTEQGRSGGERIGEILVKMNKVSEEDVKSALSRQLGIPFHSLIGIEIPRDVIALMPARMVSHYQVAPLKLEGQTLTVAVDDALDIRTIDELRLHLKKDIYPVFATAKDIHNTIKRFYGIGADTMEGMIADQASADVVEFKIGQVDDIQDMAQDASIVRFVNQIILEAIDDRATDIHVEPQEDALRIRYRIDGLLYEAAVPPSIRQFQSAIISRIKIMADMNIAERRLPQDGKIVIRKGSDDFDLRVSTIPTPYGESIVMRILSRTSEFVTLERLGFDGHHLEVLRRMILRPHGILLVTGPTGSGKSTTLYAALNEINTTDKKIITIEDPIEYRIAGVSQIQVNPTIGLSFASALRTILRQDPDVIMVGETRDIETAQITIRTALTGHLVFSTLHTNDACSAITRLLDMGIEPFLISSSIEGLLAQRLVRLFCPDCKQPYQPEPEVLKRVNITNDDPATLTILKPRGCEKCRYTGFRGRTAIYEIAQITEEFRRLVVDRAPANVLKRHAIEVGMRPLRRDGWEKIKDGKTSIDEVLRVTLEDEIMVEEAPRPAVAVESAVAPGAPAPSTAPSISFERGEAAPGPGSAALGSSIRFEP
jgi:type II secretion system protein E